MSKSMAFDSDDQCVKTCLDDSCVQNPGGPTAAAAHAITLRGICASSDFIERNLRVLSARLMHVQSRFSILKKWWWKKCADWKNEEYFSICAQRPTRVMKAFFLAVASEELWVRVWVKHMLSMFFFNQHFMTKGRLQPCGHSDAMSLHLGRRGLIRTLFSKLQLGRSTCWINWLLYYFYNFSIA